MTSSSSGQNDTALIVGFLVAVLLGIFGVGHLFNGRVGSFLVYFFLGIAWLVFMGVVLAFSGFLCSIALVPAHIILAYVISRDGAKIY